MKILLLNIAYCTGLTGSKLDYLLNFYRFAFTPRKIQKRVLHSLKNILKKHDIDLAAFIEIDSGSIASGFKNQILELVDEKYQYYDIENKYGPKSFLPRLPFFNGKSNGFVAKTPIPFKKNFLKYGTKKILFEFNLPGDITLYTFHFSLKASERKKQFHELKRIIQSKKKIIICGDFNIFGGISEVEPLLEGTDLRVVETGPTFPSKNPKITLDIFIVSKAIEVKSVEVLTDQVISDHLPVVIEI